MKPRKILKWGGIAIATPIVLFLLLAVTVYLPPVQRFAKNQLVSYLEKETGAKITLERVRLAFPLDFALDQLVATQSGDTLLAAQAVRLNIGLRPLLSGVVDVSGFELWRAKVNTKDFLSDVEVTGGLGMLRIERPATVSIKGKTVDLHHVSLADADVIIILSDTASVDTTVSEPLPWIIRVDETSVSQSRLSLTMPHDSMRLFACLPLAQVRGASFNLGQADYRVQHAFLRDATLHYDLPYMAYGRGFDPNHVGVDSLNLQLDTLSYQQGHLSAALQRLTFKEKSGLQIRQLQAHIAMDTMRVHLPLFHLLTPYSQLDATAHVVFNALKQGSSERMNADLKGHVGAADALLLMGNMAEDLRPYYPKEPLQVEAQVTGNAESLTLKHAFLNLPGLLSLKASGHGHYLTDEEKRQGLVDYYLKTQGLAPIQKIITQLAGGRVALPGAMTLAGNLNFKGQRIGTDSKLDVEHGRLTLSGGYNLKNEAYEAKVTAIQFPLHAFLPQDSLAPLTANMEARGRGLDPLKRKAHMEALFNVDHFSYGVYPLDSIRFEAKLADGKANAQFTAQNRLLKAKASLSGMLSDKEIRGKVTGRVDDLYLYYATSGGDSTHFMGDIDLSAYAATNGQTLGVEGGLRNINIVSPSVGYPADDIALSFHSAPDSTRGSLSSGDLVAVVHSDKAAMHIAESFNALAEQLQQQLQAAHFDSKALTPYVPNLDVYLRAGKQNPVFQYLHFQGYDADSVYLNLRSSTMQGIDGNLRLLSFKTGSLLLDCTTAHLKQDSTGIRFSTDVSNTSKKNPNRFTANLSGSMLTNGFSVTTLFKDEKQRKGVDLGVRGELSPQGDMTFHLFPEKSVIAFRTFTVNTNNYFTLGHDRHISANVALIADDQTALKVITPEGDSTRDVSVNLAHVNLGELSSVLPYVPQLGGLLNADVHVQWEEDNLSAVGQMDVAQLAFEEAPLGDFEAELMYLPGDDDEHFIEANISTGQKEVLSVSGNYLNKGEGLLDMEAMLTEFPAQMLNGFMGNDGTVALSGELGGSLTVKGPTSGFKINGQIMPDSLHVLSPLYGVNLSVEDKAIKLMDSRVLIENLSMYSKTSQNPFVVNGNVDLSEMDNIRMDLSFKARSFEVVSSERTKEAVLFGKVFADIDATLKGTTNFMAMRGKLKVLGSTDMTYVMKDSPLTVEDRLSGLVEFVDFSDTTEVKKEEALPAGGVFVGMEVSISDAAKLHVELSEDGDSYFDGQGAANLNLKYFPNGEITLTGRFNLTRGELKYALPFIPLKTFNLQGDNNYINFTGDPYNPSLHITAIETTRASVNDNGQSTRMVTFNVGVAITQTLNNMGLQFLIEAPEDLNVQNDLAAMSKEEQGKLAVTMLATGMYLTSTNKSSFKANNALNAFLQSEIQNIAGDALRTIDVTVGVEGSTSASGNAQTDYSFQFAKHLWNDRITIRIGGKVTAGSEASSENQSFIDNISLEYRLGHGTSRNLRLFYDHDTVDPLEGTYSSAGAGLVLRKKTDRFSEIFLFHPRRKKITTL